MDDTLVKCVEKCPFCKTEINQGASVCTGCGAYQAQTYDDWGTMLLIAGMFIVPFVFDFVFNGLISFITMVLFLVVLLRHKKNRPYVWVRKVLAK